MPYERHMMELNTLMRLGRFKEIVMILLKYGFDDLIDRLTFGIMIAAMIIGSSMIITTGIGPFLFGFPALGVVGYLISGLLGLWLIYNILRQRKY